MKVVWPGASLKIQLCPDADLTDLGLQALEILEGLRLLAGVPQQGRRVVHGHFLYAVLPENRPCSCVMRKSALMGSMALMRPRHTMILGFISRTCARR